MARLPKSGVSYMSFVTPCELQTAIAELGLKPLECDCERAVLFQLGRAIGSWWGQYKYQDARTARKIFAKEGSPYGPALANEPAKDSATVDPDAVDVSTNEPAAVVTVEEVADILTRLRGRLEAIDEALALPGSGFHEALDLAKPEAIGYIVVSLDAHVGGGNSYPGAAAHAFLADFRERARLIGRACHDAQTKLDMHRGKRGPAPYDWFDPVAAAAMLICQRNGIKTTISTNRITNEKGGRFLEVAERIEQLLPPEMRALTRDAIAKRLAGSRKRLCNVGRTRSRYRR